MDEFVPQRTSAYIGQHDLHVGEMTVRETLTFSARCQGVGTRYGRSNWRCLCVENLFEDVGRSRILMSGFFLLICRDVDWTVKKGKGSKHQARSRYWCLYEGEDNNCQRSSTKSSMIGNGCELKRYIILCCIIQAISVEGQETVVTDYILKVSTEVHIEDWTRYLRLLKRKKLIMSYLPPL